jgi:hypothetical protein
MSVILILPKPQLPLKLWQKAKLLQRVLIIGLIFVHSIFVDLSPPSARKPALIRTIYYHDCLFYLKEIKLSEARQQWIHTKYDQPETGRQRVSKEMAKILVIAQSRF